MIDNEETDRDRVSEFWEDVLGKDLRKSSDDEYAVEFADGALQLWVEVASQI